MVKIDDELYEKGASELIDFMDLILKENDYTSPDDSEKAFEEVMEMIVDDPWYYADHFGPGLVYYTIIEEFKGDVDASFAAGNEWLREYKDLT